MCFSPPPYLRGGGFFVYTHLRTLFTKLSFGRKYPLRKFQFYCQKVENSNLIAFLSKLILILQIIVLYLSIEKKYILLCLKKQLLLN